MSSKQVDLQDRSRQRLNALSRWENEGGSTPGDAPSAAPSLTGAELVQLRVRVIALENVVLALLAQASDRQLELVREMADYIAPRPGFTHHPLTIHAAARMIQLVERASHFRQPPDA